MDLVQMLSAIQQGDNATRQQAEQFMKQAEESQTAPFMAALVAELGKEEQTVIIRQQAGLYFKNMLHAEDDGIREAKEARWRDSIDDGTKVAVRSGLLQCLLSPQEQVRPVAAQGIGAVAAIDLPSKQWTGDTGVVAQILQCVTASRAPCRRRPSRRPSRPAGTCARSWRRSTSTRPSATRSSRPSSTASRCV